MGKSPTYSKGAPECALFYFEMILLWIQRRRDLECRRFGRIRRQQVDAEQTKH